MINAAKPEHLTARLGERDDKSTFKVLNPLLKPNATYISPSKQDSTDLASSFGSLFRVKAEKIQESLNSVSVHASETGLPSPPLHILSHLNAVTEEDVCCFICKSAANTKSCGQDPLPTA